MQILRYTLLIIIFFFLSCKEEQAPMDHSHHHGDPVQTEKTSNITMPAANIEMASELQKLSQETKAINSYKNSFKAKKIFEHAVKLDFSQRINQTVNGAYQSLLAGNNNDGIAAINDVKNALKQSNLTLNEASQKQIDQVEAVLYFRKGEIENCLQNHNEESCILPLSEKSYHTLPEGSTKAIQIIEQMLGQEMDLNYVWLLNLAHMTLGNYPESVPKKYLVPLGADEKSKLLPKFKNVASLIGVDDNKLSGGVVIDDLNGNGYPDILVSSWDLDDQMFFYINNGDGTFTNKYKEAGLEGITGGLNMIHGDYNNDGYEDIFVLRGAWMPYGKFPNSLLKNNGDGTFSDVTKESGIYSLQPTQTASFADFNNDGHLDVFIGNEDYSNENFQCELFLNNGDETFSNIAAEVNANVKAFVKGVTTSDYDNDGDIDIFISINGENNVLLRNDKASNSFGFNFKNVSQQAGISGPVESFPTWFFDYNNDGFDDIFVSSFSMKSYNNLSAEYAKEMLNLKYSSETPVLYQNNGDGTFTNVTIRVGLDKVCFTMGSSYGDLNNDGYLDFYLGTGEPDLKAVIPNRMFLNEGGKKFEEVTMQGGFGHLQKGHAVSFADIDFDGDQDVYAVMGGAYEGDVFFNALFENPGNENNWLKLKLEGTKTNKSAFGAKVEIVLNSNSGTRSLHRRISSGSSFGENPTLIEVGFRKNENIAAVIIDWPVTGKVEFKNLENNSFYKITEGKTDVEKKKLDKFDFKLNAHHHHH